MLASRKIHHIPIDRIAPNPDQPRRHFPPEELRSLAESIRSHGILQPLTVQKGRYSYVLVAGERRLRAAGLAGLKTVPCVIVDVSAEDSALLALIEKWVKKIPNAAGLIGSVAAFAVLRNVSGGSLGFENWVICQLPEGLYRNYLTAYLGFPQRGFYSTDYFPLIPWFFLFLAGFFLFRILDGKNLNGRLFSRGQIPVLNWLGRNSLLVYLLHQPILYGLCLLIF